MADMPPGDGPRDRAPIDAHFYALEKLTCAVEVLVSGTDRVQERLIEAARSLQRIRPEEMPEGELRRVFAGVKDDLTFEPPVGSEGAIIATLLRTPDEDASAIAGRIFLLYRELYDHLMH
jgi:hypothetical protein